MASHLSLKDVRGERTLVKPSWGALVTKVSPQDGISGEPTLPSGNTPLRRRLVGFRAVAVNSLASPVSFFGFGYLLSGSPVCDPPPPHTRLWASRDAWGDRAVGWAFSNFSFPLCGLSPALIIICCFIHIFVAARVPFCRNEKDASFTLAPRLGGVPPAGAGGGGRAGLQGRGKVFFRRAGAERRGCP